MKVRLIMFIGIAMAFNISIPFSSAHVPFLKPNQFRVIHQRLQIESAFTEFPFQADFAMNSPHFSIVFPDGEQKSLVPSAKTKAAVYLEPSLSPDGTYRITTGVRKGPVYNAVETTDGKLYFSEDTLRIIGQKTSLQYYNSADVYITKGCCNYAPMILNEGVEIIPLAAPNKFDLGDTMSFRVLHDGTPVASARVVIVYDNEHYKRHRIEDLYDVENIRESNIYSDENGVFAFTPQQAGLVLLFATIHKKINNGLWESYNTALTLEICLPSQTSTSMN